MSWLGASFFVFVKAARRMLAGFHVLPQSLLKFFSGQKCKIWPKFSIPIAFDVLWF